MADQNTEQAPAASVSPEDRMAALFGRTESETPEAEPAQDAPEAAEAASETDEQTTEQADEASDGLVDLEIDGETYRVPPKIAELKEAALRRDDYTKKTQDLADLRRQATLIVEQQQQQQQFQQATQKEHQELQAITSQIELYKKLDWTSMDSESMMRNKMAMDNLREQAQDIQKTLGQKNQEFQRSVAQKRGEMAKNAYDFVSKHVPGFAPDSDVEKAVAKYVNETGLPVDAFVNGTLAYPSVAVMAYKAMQFDKLQAGKKDAVKKVHAAPVVKPGATTTSAPSKKYQEVRASLKKSGDMRDAAKLFMMRAK